ncbi:G-protein coupled receptors family 1 profile domain-containing protein [Caenorhabditis elegans]|uniref:G-protein coupled receptors family 1 profile domain-containing protein n=1 Tax=Caenorhabditis elegans TaxID=6239 RepID=Q9XU36_CAEEL|nr:G-protein coupled receptors family 1 profile domain-containing protein [Caenorhabditis elegans]CAB07186.2 G-protein coupled receptors family 1 profile domain-containing protein [Caenorhabditis elegans]|eukprot:NP_507225.2 Serpentine Receptor, class W [Caenorhabditis elegans]
MIFTIVTISPIIYREILSFCIPVTCIPPLSYLEMYFIQLFNSLEIILTDLSVWFVVFMTIFRALVIRYPLNKRISSLVTSKYSLCAVIPFIFLVLPFWILSFFQKTLFPELKWKPSPECLGFPSNYTQIQYRFLAIELTGEFGYELTETMNNVKGILFKFLPSIALSLATFALVFEIRKRKKNKWTTGSKKERTTKLVSVVTFSFLLAIVPQGILFMIMFKVYETSVLGAVIEQLSITLSFVSVMNGIIHLLIIYSMSSEYRATAKNLCSFLKKRKNSVSIFRVTKIILNNRMQP